MYANLKEKKLDKNRTNSKEYILTIKLPNLNRIEMYKDKPDFEKKKSNTVILEIGTYLKKGKNNETLKEDITYIFNIAFEIFNIRKTDIEEHNHNLIELIDYYKKYKKFIKNRIFTLNKELNKENIDKQYKKNIKKWIKKFNDELIELETSIKLLENLNRFKLQIEKKGDMIAGTKKQMEILNKHNNELNKNEWNYEKKVEILKQNNLLIDNGYQYGTKWFINPIKKEDLKLFQKSLLELKNNEINKFIDKINNLKIEQEQNLQPNI